MQAPQPRRAARLDRIPRRSLTDAVFDQLVARIVSGRLAAGQALPPERLLCAELGVSRTAVREAMARLVQLNLVNVRHGGETRVCDFRVTGGLDLLPHLARQRDGAFAGEVLRAGLEMRAALAPELARAAALRGGEDTAAALAPILAAMAAAADDDLVPLQIASLAFWQIVVDATGNLAYQLAFNTLRDAFVSMRGEVAAAQAAELRDRAGYRAIARAIAAGEPDAAARAARAHLGLGVAGLATLAAGARARGRRPRRAS